jgi:nicotinamide riboside kinase
MRIVLTGPESTGKTTLARALAAELGAPCVPEASRLLAEAMAPAPLSENTVEPIARLAIRMGDEILAQRPEVIVFDTDLVSTIVYARHYYGSCPAWIVEETKRRRAERYLLCLPDLPWVADGVRDRPDEREALLARFREVLAEIGADATEIRGVGEARLSAVRAATRRPGA